MHAPRQGNVCSSPGPPALEFAGLIPLLALTVLIDAVQDDPVALAMSLSLRYLGLLGISLILISSCVLIMGWQWLQ